MTHSGRWSLSRVHDVLAQTVAQGVEGCLDGEPWSLTSIKRRADGTLLCRAGVPSFNASSGETAPELFQAAWR
jgi:hypothetical protein